MLTGIDPLLSGGLLAGLDAMGHSDAVCLADAHFPADRLADRLLVFPGLNTPDLLRAIRTVLPLDATPAVDLMTSSDGSVLPVQRELMASAGVDVDSVQFVDRYDFYERAGSAYVVIRTGETRTYGNVIVRKGVVPDPAGGGH